MSGIILQYKGFMAFARFYPKDGYYHGSLEGIQAHATFGGESVQEVTQDFHDLVNDYLADAEAQAKDPLSSRKLIIDMSDYPFQNDQAVSLQFAEPEVTYSFE